MVKNVSFDKKQIAYLDKYFSERRDKFLKEVNKDSFDGGEKAINDLCDRFFNTNDLKSEKVGAKVGAKNSKKTKKAKTGYMKWLWSNNGIKKLKSENTDLKYPQLFSLAGKKWSAMSDSEKNAYK